MPPRPEQPVDPWYGLRGKNGNARLNAPPERAAGVFTGGVRRGVQRGSRAGSKSGHGMLREGRFDPPKTPGFTPC